MDLQKCDECSNYFKTYFKLFKEDESEPEISEIMTKLKAVQRIYETDHYSVNPAQTQYHKRALKFFLAKCFDTLGLYWYKHVEFEDAIEYFTRATEWDAKYPNAFYNRAVVHYRYGDFQLAMKDMERAVELDPKNDNFRKGLEEVKKVVNDEHSETPEHIDHDLKNFEYQTSLEELKKCANDISIEYYEPGDSEPVESDPYIKFLQDFQKRKKVGNRVYKANAKEAPEDVQSCHGLEEVKKVSNEICSANGKIDHGDAQFRQSLDLAKNMGNDVQSENGELVHDNVQFHQGLDEVKEVPHGNHGCSELESRNVQVLEDFEEINEFPNVACRENNALDPDDVQFCEGLELVEKVPNDEHDEICELSENFEIIELENVQFQDGLEKGKEVKDVVRSENCETSSCGIL